MRRFELILIAALMILVVFIGAVLLRSGYFQSSDQAKDPEARIAAVPEVLTANSAYDKAHARAQRWAKDAEMITAQATWQVVPEFEYNEASWGFVFYSESESSTALISVTESGAGLLDTNGTNRQLNPADLTGWQVDSPQMIETMMNSGGRPFLDRLGEATLVLTLDAAEKPVWKAKLFHEVSGETLSVEADPALGEITSVEQTQ
jgi:Tfp pilus assembly protein PilV